MRTRSRRRSAGADYIKGASCDHLDTIDPNFHATLQSVCPLCNGTGSQCIVETLSTTTQSDEEQDPLFFPKVAASGSRWQT